MSSISKRAEARRSESAFKRSLCVYILAIMATDVVNYGGDIKQDMDTISEYTISQVKRWRKEFVEVESIINFIEWRNVQSPRGNILLYSIALPVILGVLWYFITGKENIDTSNNSSIRSLIMNFHFTSWKEYALSFCLISIIVSIIISTMYTDELSNSSEKLHTAEWTLVEMCNILSPPQRESTGNIYHSSIRQQETIKKKKEKITNEKQQTQKQTPATTTPIDGNNNVGEDDAASILNLQFPNDLTEKLENLVKIMENDNKCDSNEINKMKARLNFAKNIENNGEGVEYSPKDI